MSHEAVNEILSKFKEKFPPVSDLGKSRLKMTTGDISSMITDLEGKDLGEDVSLFQLLKDNDYVYFPVEVNERVVFYWLIG